MIPNNMLTHFLSFKETGRLNELDILAAPQFDEVSFGSQLNDSFCALFSVGIVDFRDKAGKRLWFFLGIGFHRQLFIFPILASSPF